MTKLTDSFLDALSSLITPTYLSTHDHAAILTDLHALLPTADRSDLDRQLTLWLNGTGLK